MSSAGIYAELYDRGTDPRPCLIIGLTVPRIHHSQGVPVYLVTEHELGVAITCRDGKTRKLLAYPSAWPGPGERSERAVYARHERLPWDAPIPCFDAERVNGAEVGYPT